MSAQRKVAIAQAGSYEAAAVRDGLREAFSLLGFDTRNPLGSIVRPGDSVFIKPNWVSHEYRRSAPRQDDVYSTITHPALLRELSDLVATALDGKGRIVIGDNPSIDADFDALRRLVQLDDLQTRYGVPCEILDLRPLRCADLSDYGIKSRMQRQTGDPQGYVTVDLGRRSLLHHVDARRFRGVFTDRSETVARHSGDRQEYEFSASIFAADVYISVPKLKTHHKVGTTLNLKGLVGAMHNKNLLVHWRQGWPGVGGDEYPSFLHWVKGQLARVKKRGAWHGNDTIWRMVVDLYTAFATRPRRTLSVVDGIVGGEGDGPFCPRAKASGTIVAGEDLLAVDCVASRLMGFDIGQIPYLRHLLLHCGLSTTDIEVRGTPGGPAFFDAPDPYLAFEPPTAWSNLTRWRQHATPAAGRRPAA